MKNMICLVAALAVCLTLTCPVLAVGDGFAPSVGYKDGPEIVDAEMKNGSEGDETENVGVCLVVTSLKAAEEQSTDITEGARELLLEVYDELMSGEMELPAEEGYVVRDLVDVSWSTFCCEDAEHDHEEALKELDVTVAIDFDMGVPADAEVEVYVYIDGKWEPVVSVENNGDGTITCVFEDFCPVAFVVREQTGGSDTGDPAGQNLILWIALMAVSVVAILFLIFKRRKRT